MILPHSTYKTNRPVTLFSSSRDAVTIVLAEHTRFRVSIWNEGEELILVEMVDTEPAAQGTLSISADEILSACTLVTDFSEAIYFYSALEDYGDFSNFSPHGFEVNGIFYKTVEHYYQSEKFTDEHYRERIIHSATPKDAADMGKTKLVPVKANWDEVKRNVMSSALEQKLRGNAGVRGLLLSTGDKLIIENSPYDNYWGIGRSGTGKNHLGTLLMRARQLLA